MIDMTYLTGKPMRHKHMMNGGLLGSIRELVFGLEDSFVSTLGVVIGVAAGTSDQRVVILSGIVLVVVEALSMAAGSFLSSKSHREMLGQAIKEEEWEIENEPEKETEELRAMYRVRGFSDTEIDILVRRITANKKLWLEEMMAKELKIGANELSEPRQSAVVMFLSYVVGGIVPVLPFVFFPAGTASLIAVGCTGAGLFLLGWWKAKVTANDPLRSGVEMITVAGAAALLGYLVGKGLGAAFGIDVTG
jgi:predicted membrane protein (TIGR00267 family)